MKEWTHKSSQLWHQLHAKQPNLKEKDSDIHEGDADLAAQIFCMFWKTKLSPNLLKPTGYVMHQQPNIQQL
jgi:hypothetical protein